MKLGILTTVYGKSALSTYMLRTLIESIQRTIPRERYQDLLVVDDCSPRVDPHEAYLQHLVASDTARVYRLGPPRGQPYYNTQRGGDDVSFGLAVGVMAGFEALRTLGCTHAWVLDADSVVLNDPFPEALDLFQYRKVVTVGDYLGGSPSKFDVLCGHRWEEVYDRVSGDQVARVSKDDKPAKTALRMYGVPNTSCWLVDLAVEEQFGPLRNVGWIHARWMHRLFRHGYQAGYFPFYQKRFVFHLGFGFALVNTEISGRGFGNASDDQRYGGKGSGIFHAGYLQWSGTTRGYRGWLSEVYAGLPPDVPGPEFPLDRLIPPSVQVPTVQERYIRRTVNDATFDLVEGGQIIGTATLDTSPPLTTEEAVLSVTLAPPFVTAARYRWAIEELFEHAYGFWERTTIFVYSPEDHPALASMPAWKWSFSHGAWTRSAGKAGILPGPPEDNPRSKVLYVDEGVLPFVS